MGTRPDQQLQSLDQLLTQQNVKKASTLGTIIDSTNAYFDYKENKHVKKLKIIDESMNMTKTTADFRFGYCTVFFFADSVEGLPNPCAVGDVVYLRRFAFEVYDQCFQARNNPAVYCSWALLRGDAQNGDFGEYQLSKANFNLSEEKYNSMKENVKNLRLFSKQFLSKNSILMTVPAGVNPKDQDLVVQVIRKSQNGTFRVRDGKREMIVRNCPSFVEQKQIAKLRSVANVIADKDGQNEVIKNNFTSLIKLPEWTADSQKFLQQQSAMQMEEEIEMYTDLDYLNSAPLSQIQGKIFNVKCEVFNSSAKTFRQAVKYYDQRRNAISDSPTDSSTAVYKLVLSCQDDSSRIDKSGRLSDIWLFSHDGQGSDFVDRVNLNMLNELSSFKQEEMLFESRMNAILQSDQVRIIVEVLNDGKGNRTFRALNVKC